AGHSQVAIWIPVWQVGWRVKAADRMARDGREFVLPLGTLGEGRAKRVLFPGFFPFRRLTRFFRRIARRYRCCISATRVTHERPPPKKVCALLMGDGGAIKRMLKRKLQWHKRACLRQKTYWACANAKLDGLISGESAGRAQSILTSDQGRPRFYLCQPL